jgi:hypothetical protein
MPQKIDMDPIDLFRVATQPPLPFKSAIAAAATPTATPRRSWAHGADDAGEVEGKNDGAFAS